MTLTLLVSLLSFLAAPGGAYHAIGRAGSDANAAAREDNGSYPSNGRQSPSQRPALGDVPSDPTGAETAGSPALRGIASYVDPRYGSRYLALPGGPGISVRICHGSRCILRVSTDAGPDKAMQRAGRVADLSYADFRTLCRCKPEAVGLLRVTVTSGGPSLPQTDTEEMP